MRIRSRWLMGVAGGTALTAFKGLARTLTYETHAVGTIAHTPVDPATPPCIFCFWHDAILLPCAMRAVTPHHRPVRALVSRHQDGSYLTNFMDGLEIGSVRGSTQRGGDAALWTLIRECQDAHVMITPDGPRGPRHHVKPGLIFLASQTGKPIVMAGFAGSAGWRIPGKWTDLFVPRPFSRVVMVLSDPLHVPQNVSRSALTDLQSRIDSEMVRLQGLANGVLRGEAIPRPTQRKAA